MQACLHACMFPTRDAWQAHTQSAQPLLQAVCASVTVSQLRTARQLPASTHVAGLVADAELLGTCDGLIVAQAKLAVEACRKW